MKTVVLLQVLNGNFLAELIELYQRANQAETEYQEWLAWLKRQVGQDQDTSSKTLENRHLE